MIDIVRSFNISLFKQNNATLVFDKLPLQKEDIDRIKQWIDLIAAPLIETKSEENNHTDS